MPNSGASSSNIHGEIVQVQRSPKEATMHPVDLEEVQRIPTWFVRLVTATIAFGTPWAVFVTYNTLANQFTVNQVSAEVSGIKGDMAAIEKASGQLTTQTVELRSDLRYLTAAMARFDEGTDERADIKASVRRLETDVKELHSMLKSQGQVQAR